MILALMPASRLFAFQTHAPVHGKGGGSMRQVTLDDPAFAMPAYSLNIPDGWKFEGTVRRDIGCSPQDAFQTYRLTSPDGLIVIGVKTPFFTAFPPAMIQGMDFSQCGVVLRAVPTGQLLTQYIIPAIAPGAQVVSAPEAVPNAAQWNEQLTLLPGIPGATQEASRVRIAYSEGGRAWEAWIVGLTTYKQMGGQGFGFSKTVVGSVRAPQGRLAEAERNLDWALKLSANPAWIHREMQRANQSQAQAQAAGEQTRAGIAAQAQANINATGQRTQQTIDSIHATGKASSDAARNRENARHSAAVDAANYAGDKPTTYYHWRNTVTGERKVTNNPTNPGPNWVSTDR
jgi:hypothetical protein